MLLFVCFVYEQTHLFDCSTDTAPMIPDLVLLLLLFVCLFISSFYRHSMIPDLAGDDDTTYFEELDENSVPEPEVFPNSAVRITFHSVCSVAM